VSTYLLLFFVVVVFLDVVADTDAPIDQQQSFPNTKTDENAVATEVEKEIKFPTKSKIILAINEDAADAPRRALQLRLLLQNLNLVVVLVVVVVVGSPTKYTPMGQGCDAKQEAGIDVY